MMSLTLFPVICVTVLGIVLLLKKVSYPTAFFCTAVFAHQTSIVYANISTAMILVASVLLFAASRFDIAGKSFVRFFGIFCVALCLTMLSTLNFASVTEAVGKAGKLALAFAPLFFQFRRKDGDLYTVIKTFAWTSLITGFAQIVLFGAHEGMNGMPRFSGFMEDANYFASIVLLMLIYLDRVHARRTRNLKLLLFCLIVLSQSATVLTFTALYFFGRKLSRIRVRGRSIQTTATGTVQNTLRDRSHVVAPADSTAIGARPVFSRRPMAGRVRLAVLPVVIACTWVGFVFYIQIVHGVGQLFNDQGDFIAMKSNSFLFRLMSQFSAVEMMVNDPDLLLYGYGSGKSVDLFGRVQHNVYMQILFDHGIFGLAFLVVILAAAARRFAHVPFVYLFLLIANCLFDTVSMFIFSFALFLFANPSQPEKSWK